MSRSPILTPVNVLRQSDARPNFDGAEDLVLERGPRSRGARTSTVTSVVTPVVVSQVHHHVPVHPSRMVHIVFSKLEPQLQCAHVHIAETLAPFPMLDGLIACTPAQLATFPALQKYLKSALCEYPEGVCKALSLRTLIKIVQGVRGFQHVSDAMVAAAIVERRLHDPGTWTFGNTGKLDCWLVRASFWDVHTVYQPFVPRVDDSFHTHLILAAKELDLGPVCLAGHTLLLPIIRQYVRDIEAVAPGRCMSKRSVDCLVATFGSQECLQLLHQTLFADALDGLSVPLPSVGLDPGVWTPRLRAFVHGKEHVTPATVHGPLGDDILAAARPFVWLLVAADAMVHPMKQQGGGGGAAATWESAHIAWDPLDSALAADSCAQ